MLRRSFLSTGGLAAGALALRPAARALSKEGIHRAEAVLQEASAKGTIGAAALYVRQGEQVHRAAFGKARVDTVFLLASITKPMTATAVMRLVDRKQISLEDAVRKHIPEFSGGDRDLVTVRHLLTHTSGLPDMLPENEELRKKHAPLADFVAGTCKTPLLFKPGTRCQYQSMGILLAAEIAQRVTRMPFRDYLKQTVFAPLGMSKTSLGLGGRQIADTAWSEVTGNDDWNWNSPYWRDLGAPWGGAHATAEDVARFLEYFLAPHERVVRPETAAAMIVNQNAGLNSPYGIGWSVRGYPKTCSARTFGHGGSTGTTCWADPASRTSFVLLTTRPASESQKTVLTPVSEAIAGAAV
jgi:CubicO group peptidase (beta-lactamase class C family)